MYDFLITFGREVDHIWRQKLTGATALFILMRYAHFFDAIVVMLEIFPWAGQTNRVRIYPFVEAHWFLRTL